MAASPRAWDRAISVLVPVALIAAMLAYAFPFFNPIAGRVYLPDTQPETGIIVFMLGFLAVAAAGLPEMIFAISFSLPMILALVGLMCLRRPGWSGSVGPLVCSVLGSMCLGYAYFWETQDPLAYGYFVAEAAFVIAAVASAVRVIRMRHGRLTADAAVPEPFEPAASASQQLLARYRN